MRSAGTLGQVLSEGQRKRDVKRERQSPDEMDMGKKGKGSAREVKYEEEWAEYEEEGADIGGIWQVVKGRKTARKEHGRECGDKTPKRRYNNRWEALEDEEEEDILHLSKDHTRRE